MYNSKRNAQFYYNTDQCIVKSALKVVYVKTTS